MHAFPSSQLVPLGAGGLEHSPLVGSHAPAAWHWSLAMQTIALLPVHVPPWQASACVHALPSLHATPSGNRGFEQDPELGSQVPATWHWSLAVHRTRSEPTQRPALQASLRVHAFPSLQLVPSAAAGFEHVPVCRSHVPAT